MSGWVLCPGLVMCHTFREHINHWTLLWNFNIYIMLVLFVNAFPPLLFCLMFKIISWGDDLFYYICWKPRIQIFKWFPQGNKNELGNFILLIPQIYYCSKVLNSGYTSLKQLHFLHISYNIKTRFFGHKSEALWRLASAYLVNLIFFTTFLLIWWSSWTRSLTIVQHKLCYPFFVPLFMLFF